jgi:hypothetical protein
MNDFTPRARIEQYFAGLTESTFLTELGVIDPPMVDYISDLLVRFVRSDVVHRVRSVTGRPVLTLTEMAVEAAHRLGDAKREIHRHIGDFALFWAGVYPEALRRDDPEDAHSFVVFCSQGRRSYQIAAEIETETEIPPPEVLQRLSDRFDLCTYGLREIRRRWETNDDGSSGLLLFN